MIAVRFQVQDSRGCVLAAADDEPEAVRILHAFAAAATGNELDLFLVAVGANGIPVAPARDIFEL